MKRIVSVVLAMMLIVASSATTVFAKPNFKKGNGNFIPPGIAKKLFDDSDEVQWAQKSIEKLKSKGLVRGTDGKYLPNRSVSKIEAVVMALRIMDWEDEALSIHNLPGKYKGDQVQNWAVGYVAVAYEKGILDDVDLMYFKPNEPAKRHEVAKYVIRALDKEDEAKDHMHEDLNFVDAAAIPQGSVGYVYLVNELGLMTGDGKRFNPMGTLTRAEMAVLFSNLDDKVDSNKDVNEYTGTVQDINDDEIVLKVGSSNKSFKISDDVVAYDGRTKIDYSDIKDGKKVLIQVENSKVVYIEVLNGDSSGSKIISRYTGELTKIGTGNPDTITVKIQDMTATFNVIDNVAVYFKGTKGDLSQLKAGDDVTVMVDNRNRAIKIYVNREKGTANKDQVEGKITAIDLTGEYHISVDGKQYSLSKDAKVEIDSESAALKDLVVGMKIEAQLEDDEVTSISAEELVSEVKGTIEEVNENWIKVLVDGKVKEYDYADRMAVKVEGHSANLDDLEKGMKVDLELKNNLVASIEADDHKFDVDGKIVDIIKSSNTYKLKLKVDNEETTYDVDKNVEIKVKGIRNPEMSDLKEGQKGEFEILNNTIVKIDVED